MGPSQLEVVEIPDPQPGSHALVRVAQAGVCGTDVKVFKGQITGPRPMVMGHEMVGIPGRSAWRPIRSPPQPAVVTLSERC